jgi:methionyl-tRNA formyltransferase
MKRIAFLGSGEIGVPTLRWLAGLSGASVVSVVCQPDKPVGRKLTLTPPPTKRVALELGLPVFQPARLRREIEPLVAVAPDVIIVMAYGQILPRSVLDLPPLGCVNLHASLLPKYRGAAPIQAAIRDGEVESGLTLMRMDEGLDTGAILGRVPLALAADETGGTLHDRLAAVGPVAPSGVWDALMAGQLTATPQDETQATHVGKLARADGVIDWSQSAATLERLIRAYDPWPGTSTSLLGMGALKVFPPCEVVAEFTGCPAPGTILAADSAGLLVACGHGALRLQSLQPEARKRMPAAAYIAGAPELVGARLGG